MVGNRLLGKREQRRVILAYGFTAQVGRALLRFQHADHGLEVSLGNLQVPDFQHDAFGCRGHILRWREGRATRCGHRVRFGRVLSVTQSNQKAC